MQPSNATPWPLIVGLAAIAISILTFNEMRLHAHELLHGHAGITADFEGLRKQIEAHHNEVHSQIEHRMQALEQRDLEQAKILGELRERVAVLEKEKKQ